MHTNKKNWPSETVASLDNAKRICINIIYKPSSRELTRHKIFNTQVVVYNSLISFYINNNNFLSFCIYKCFRPAEQIFIPPSLYQSFFVVLAKEGLSLSDGGAKHYTHTQKGIAKIAKRYKRGTTNKRTYIRATATTTTKKKGERGERERVRWSRG